MFDCKEVLLPHHLHVLQMERLRCFMYVSTAYSNAHLGKNSTVNEQLYHLQEPNGQDVDHVAIVTHLLALPASEAQSEVCLIYPAYALYHVNASYHFS